MQFNSDGLKVFTDGTFTVNNVNSYIIILKISVGGYISPWGCLAELCKL
jgi:hypothetical protein